MKQKLSAILFDLDNTFYAYNPCHKKALAACEKYSREKGLFPSRVAFIKGYDQARREIKKQVPYLSGSHSRLLYFQRLLEIKGVEVKPTIVLRLSQLYWNIYIKTMQLETGAMHLLARLKASNVQVAMLSDQLAHIQFQKLKALRISRYIHSLTTSEEAGREKPNPAIARIALKKLKVPATEVCVVGEDLERDIGMADRFKVFSIWYKRPGAKFLLHFKGAKPDCVVTSFKQLESFFFSDKRFDLLS